VLVLHDPPTRGLVEAVGHGLEEDGHRADLLGVRLEPVRQMTAVGQVQARAAGSLGTSICP
jgi:hypothetical protein